jgi:hypothetical protein
MKKLNELTDKLNALTTVINAYEKYLKINGIEKDCFLESLENDFSELATNLIALEAEFLPPSKRTKLN